jgi:flagellar hook-length control protein FliK
LNLIQLATALPAISVGPVKPNAAISADVSGFALAMGALTAKIAAPAAGPLGKAGDAAVPLPEGQDLAETGKELPDAVLGLEGKDEDKPAADTDKDEDKRGEDAPPPPFAWFAVAPAPTPQPEAKAEASATATADVVETGGKRARREVQLPVAETGELLPEAKAEAAATKPVAASTVPPIVLPEAKPQPATRRTDVQRQPKVDATNGVAPTPAEPAEAPVTEAATAPTTASTATTDTSTAETPVPAVLTQAPRELRKAAAEAPVVRITRDAPAPQQKLSIADLAPAQPAAAAPQSVADQVFAAFDLSRQRPGANAAGDPQADLSAVTAQATGAQTATAVTATGQGQDAMLDTRDQQWTAKMIDKIAALQDGGPVRETKLSLMPEGLGKVDIAIRQDDSGSLHVQFNTDTQSARQLIADAQPKLAEIAQERGIRLGSTSVESNATGTGAGSNANSQMNQGQQGDARPQRNQPSAPPSARREAQTSTDSDERVA